MFTLEQISDLHSRLGRADTLADYVRGLHAIGIVKYDSYLTDGHTEYFGKHNEKVVSPAEHEKLSVAENGNKENLLHHLKLHEQRKTTYIEMSKGLAESGIEKWTVDSRKMTMTFCDRAGNALLVEKLE
jgi:uncharacterized protein YbcV (DUF1398 family)